MDAVSDWLLLGDALGVVDMLRDCDCVVLGDCVEVELRVKVPDLVTDALALPDWLGLCVKDGVALALGVHD